MQTERLTILVSPALKAEIAARAAARHVSIGRYMREKFEGDDDLTPDQEVELAALVAQANEAIPAMAASLDRMSEMVREASVDIRRTIDTLEKR